MSNKHALHRSTAVYRATRYVLAVIAFFGFLWAALSYGCAGVSRLLSYHGRVANLLAPVNKAVELSPSDPEAHRARAIVLLNSGQFREAIGEFERAVALRYRHYQLWLELGRARDLANQEEGALMAFKEAVRLAPHYAEPRWQLGNVLLRRGRRDEAVTELRRAALSDATLLPATIDLAWGAYGGDARAVEQALQPQTDMWRFALAHFFTKKGKTAEALSLFRMAGAPSREGLRTLLTELLAAKQYAAAYEVWASVEERATAAARGGDGRFGLIDGSFEHDISLDKPGFGWQLAQGVQTVRITLDSDEHYAGAQSLRLEWSGNPDPASSIISQLVLTEPNTRYHLRFAARTQEVLTGGSPAVVVSDASASDARPLGQSNALPLGTTVWREHTVEFTTGEMTKAVLISLRRQNCSRSPCPIFGQVWLDDFSMQKL